MTKATARAGTSPFAHLLAVTGLARGKRAEEETPVDEEGPSNEDDAEDTEEPLDDVEEGGDGKKGKAKGKRASAKDDDDDQDAEADAGDDDMDAEEGEDDEKAQAFRDGMALGRARENARCARIFRSKAAAGRPDIAATLAFTTRNTSAEAGRLMNAVGAAAPTRGRGLSDRMDGRAEARPGAGGDRGKPSFAERVAAAKKKAGIS